MNIQRRLVLRVAVRLPRGGVIVRHTPIVAVSAVYRLAELLLHDRYVEEVFERTLSRVTLIYVWQRDGFRLHDEAPSYHKTKQSQPEAEAY